MIDTVYRMDWTRAIFNLPYNAEWKRLRRIFTQQFSAAAARDHRGAMQSEVGMFLHRFDGSPTIFRINAHRFDVDHSLFRAIALITDL